MELRSNWNRLGMFDNSVIRRTGQWWKVLLGFWGVGLSGALMIAGIVLGLEFGHESSWFMIMTIVGTFLGLGFFVFLCASVKCPDCGVKWYWAAASKKHAKGWDRHVLLLSTCPACNGEKH